MNLSAQAKLAESADQYLVTWPLFFGLIGLNTGASALQFFYSKQEFAWMRLLDLALTLAVLGACVLFIWRLARFVRDAKACNSRGVIFLEGFLNRSNLQAMAFSWFVTFFTGTTLGEWTEPEVLFPVAQELTNLQPARFYFYVLTACQCVSYALFFFLLPFLQAPQYGGDDQ